MGMSYEGGIATVGDGDWRDSGGAMATGWREFKATEMREKFIIKKIHVTLQWVTEKFITI